MTDSEHDDPLRRWLVDDPFVLNTILLVAAGSLAVAVTSCIWHHVYSADRQRPDGSSAPFLFRVSPSRTLPLTGQQQPLPVSSAAEQKEPKSARSKDRRRRGKDPFRDLLKGGKKSKALLKAIKVLDSSHTSPPADTLSNASASASSTSRSQSPEPVCAAPSRAGESDDGSSVLNNDTTATSAVVSGYHNVSRAYSHTDIIRPHSCPPDSMVATDVQANISSASTVIEHVPEVVSSSPPIPVASIDLRTPQPRVSQAEFASEDCTNLVRARTRLRATKIDQHVRSLSSSAVDSDSVATSVSCFDSTVPCPSLTIAALTGLSTDGAGQSAESNSRSSRPLSRSSSLPGDTGDRGSNTQPLEDGVITTEELESMRGALEAARTREERLRVEAEQASKERDELCWRWNEEAGVWRRREAELQGQIHHLVQQVQAYAAVASFQTQQASNLSSPTSPQMQHHVLAPFPLPPAIQTQNSASAPAHVQALLTSHPPGFTSPVSGGLYSGAGFGMSPLMWSGMGLCVPNREPRYGGRCTPDSSASSPRGRQRGRQTENTRSASDDSSLGDWDGAEDGSGEEDAWEGEEEDVFRNNALADAILKRPESIRSLNGSVRRRSGRGRTERMDALKDPLMNKTMFVPPLVDGVVMR